MIVHCNTKIEAFEKFYLYPDKTYESGYMEVAVCPQCEKFLVRVVRRTYDGYESVTVKKQNKARALFDKMLPMVMYKASDVTRQKGTFGLCYGTYTEVKDKDGNVIKVIEKKTDFYGKTEKVKEILI